MIQFASAQYLMLLLLIPVFFLVFAVVMKFRQRRIRKFGDETLVRQLMPSYAKGKAWLRLSLFAVGFFFFVIGLSRPQIGAKLKEHETKGAEIMIVLDVSNSMLAEDYSPTALRELSWRFQGWSINFVMIGSVLLYLPEILSCSCLSLLITFPPRCS